MPKKVTLQEFLTMFAAIFLDAKKNVRDLLCTHVPFSWALGPEFLGLVQWFLTFSFAGTPFESPTNSRTPI